MAYYMTQFSFTSEALKGLVANPQDRAAVMGKVIEAAGGKLLHYFYSFGEYDGVVISEAPDNSRYSSVAFAAIAGGAMSEFKTTVLMTSDEFVEALTAARAVAYTPPGS